MPTPESTPAPRSDVLTPLMKMDSQPGELDVSDAELACLTETVSEDSVVMTLTMPEMATEEDAAALLTCMEDDTLLRWYLTPFLQQTGALSPESSSCIRSGFATTDIAALMLAVATGQGREPSDEAAAMMTAMAGFLVTLSCLNEEEFLSAAPALGIAPEEQAGFQCVMEQLGGPEEMAALMAPDAGPPLQLLQAAATCQIQLGGG